MVQEHSQDWSLIIVHTHTLTHTHTHTGYGNYCDCISLTLKLMRARSPLSRAARLKGCGGGVVVRSLSDPDGFVRCKLDGATEWWASSCKERRVRLFLRTGWQSRMGVEVFGFRGEWPRRRGTGDWEEAPYGLLGLRLRGELLLTERRWRESIDLGKDVSVWNEWMKQTNWVKFSAWI